MAPGKSYIAVVSTKQADTLSVDGALLEAAAEKD